MTALPTYRRRGSASIAAAGSTCKECGRAGICQHQRRRSTVVEWRRARRTRRREKGEERGEGGEGEVAGAVNGFIYRLDSILLRPSRIL